MHYVRTDSGGETILPMVQSIRFKPAGIMVFSRRIHLFSSLSRLSLDSTLSGGDGIKLRIVIPNLLELQVSLLWLVHRFRCLATVVSQSWSISLKWPWNLVSRRFLVWPTYCISQTSQICIIRGLSWCNIMRLFSYDLWLLTLWGAISV